MKGWEAREVRRAEHGNGDLSSLMGKIVQTWVRTDTQTLPAFVHAVTTPVPPQIMLVPCQTISVTCSRLSATTWPQGTSTFLPRMRVDVTTTGQTEVTTLPQRVALLSVRLMTQDQAGVPLAVRLGNLRWERLTPACAIFKRVEVGAFWRQGV